MEIVGKILRFAWAFIDSGIVWVIRTVYNLFYNLSDLMLYSEKIVESLGQRIGLVLGIFMLFRLAVTLVTYMISPDKLNDNAKGGGKLMLNIGVTLVLLATINLIFVQAYKIQDMIVRSGFIEKIFFGSKVDPEDKQQLDISYYLYTPLFEPNEAVFGDVCKELWDPNEKIDLKDGGACDAKLYELLGDDRRAVYRAFNSQDMSYVLSNYNVVTAKQNGEYAFDYKIVAPVAGVICALVLVSFCMDLATRAIKLLFLQIIAPIPIISNVDPGKGQEIFKKWYQECFKTYLSVFIRIITINFAVYIITVILTEFKSLFVSDPMINIALIIGELIFAKQVTKLIENIFGIKTEGAFTLNPIKKFQDQALFSKQIMGLGAAGLAGGAAMGANLLNGIYSNQHQKGLKGAVVGLAKGFGSGIAGGISAAGRGTVGAIKGQKFNDIYKSSYGGAIKARNNREERNRMNVNGVDLFNHQITHAVGAATIAEQQDASIKVWDEFTTSAESAVSISESEVDKNDNKLQLRNFGGTVSEVNNTGGRDTFNTLAELREAMNDQTKYDAYARARLQAQYNKIRGDIAEEMRTQIHDPNADITRSAKFSYVDPTSGRIKQIFDTDNQSLATIEGQMKNAESIVEANQNDDIFKGKSIDGKTIKDIGKKTKNASTTLKLTNEYKSAHAIQQQAQREGKK